MHMYMPKSLLFRSHEVFYRNSFYALPKTHVGMNLCHKKQSGPKTTVTS